VNVAFVAPFYGAQASGGAETACRQIAIHLNRSGIEVEIYTTCARDLQQDWSTLHYPAGTHREDDLPVHRFRTPRLRLDRFGALNGRLIRREPLSRSEEEQFMAFHVTSFDLLRALAANGNRHDWICFIPYLFGTTYHGSRLFPERSILIPCLHDEGYAHMQIVHDMFHQAAKLAFNAPSEQALAQSLYKVDPARCVVTGIGIDTGIHGQAERFRSRFNIQAPFILYAGRKDTTKNVHTLVNHFAAYLGAHPQSPLRLLMIGPGTVPIPTGMKDRITDLGFVSETDKQDAYAAAWALCQPSRNESFSIVMMEAWLHGTPSLVHGDCAVTRGHVVQSGGGLYFNTPAEFSACIDQWTKDPALHDAMGAAGRRYVGEQYAWDRVVARYRHDVFGLPA